MRSKDAALVAHLAGDELDLVTLVEIDVADDEDPLRYAIDTEERTWNGYTWTPTSGALSEVQESAEREVPTTRLVLQNADGVLGPLIYPPAGGRDLRGRRVTLRQGARPLLTGGTAADRVIEVTLLISSCSIVGRELVLLELGLFPAGLRVPDRRLQGRRCRWRYKGLHCGYVGSLPTCDRSREDCRRHFPAEPLPFGGFPTGATTRATRVV